MPRRLTDIEIAAFLSRHPDVRAEVHIANSGAPYGFRPELVYPGAGIAVRDPSGRYVLVWRDYSKRWHYIDLWDVPFFANQVNKPPFISIDSSMLKNMLSELERIGAGAAALVDLVPLILGGLIVYNVYLLVRR